MPQAYDIEAIRQKYIGTEIATARGRYPVEYDAIRRHCHMVDDNNPLFLDPDYANSTEHGAVLCPPSGWLALYFASLGP
ncbi:MAG: MaoC family dehydratase N-terminal domain-containing protein, partial [Chloroflexi bacterium]|nr:MaoC family dehydratase N-terminal domain-containing protein [Chloroflexota bacterium]